jgi:hypothetical protein
MFDRNTITIGLTLAAVFFLGHILLNRLDRESFVAGVPELCSDASPCDLSVPKDHDYSSDYGTYSDYPASHYDLGGGYNEDPKGTYYDDVPAPKLHNTYHANDDSSYGKDDYSYDGSGK